MIKNLPPSGGDLRDMGSIPGLGRSPGGGHENSFLRNLVGSQRVDMTEVTEHTCVHTHICYIYTHTYI